MNKVNFISLCALICVFVTQPCLARDDFKSCYGLVGKKIKEQNINRELFIVVDQTVVFDVGLKKQIHSMMHRFIKPGDRVTLLSFSAYAKGQYAKIPLTGLVDVPIPDDQRRDIGIPKLKKFDRCMKQQLRDVHRAIDVSLKKVFHNASTDLPKTELTGSLSYFGGNLIAKSTAKRKVVLVVSDMLENSDVVSFYSHGKIVPIDIESSIARLKEVNIVTDWAGAELFIVGAAYVSNGQYKSEKVLRNIRMFWEEFFTASNADLKEWGQPMLMLDIY